MNIYNPLPLPVAVASGGTGSTTAANARTALGVTATGADTTYAFRANNLSDLANAGTARTNLGLGTMAQQATTANALGFRLDQNSTSTVQFRNANSVDSGSRMEFQVYAGDVEGRINAINTNGLFVGTTSAHDVNIQRGNSTIVVVGSGGTDTTGEVRCDTLRIDAAPTAETPPATHTAVINLNGTSYKFLCLAA